MSPNRRIDELIVMHSFRGILPYKNKAKDKTTDTHDEDELNRHYLSERN